MQMQIPSNVTFGFIISELFLVFLISILILFYGISFTKSYVSKKEWDDSFRPVIIVNLIWFVTNMIFEFIFLYFLGTTSFLVSIISDFVRIIVGIVIISGVVSNFYNKDFKESLIFASLFQVLLYGMVTLLGIFIGLIRTMITSSDEAVFGGGMTLFLIGIVLLGVNTFYINSGNKAQFVKNRTSIVLWLQG